MNEELEPKRTGYLKINLKSETNFKNDFDEREEQKGNSADR